MTDPDPWLSEAYRNMEVAIAHREAGLAPSAVLFATTAALAAVRQVYFHRFEQEPAPDMSMSRMISLICGYPGHFPEGSIAMLEVSLIRSQHPSSLSALLDEMPEEVAGDIFRMCQEVLVWAENECTPSYE